MNKYLKKCLVTYIALTVILCSMAGIAYAVTATDADSYVTRSQFSTDMTYLQSVIGEQEAGLIGSINKYRSTDVKFVTFDTPTTQVTGTGFESGKFTGGNYYPRTKFSGSSGSMYPFGTSAISARTDGMYQMTYLHRLWNGNYYLSNDILYRTTTDSSTGTDYYSTMRCAVPVENLPGWYLVLATWQQTPTTIEWLMSLVKLDATVPLPSDPEMVEIYNKELIIRLKKDLWQYVGDGTPRVTTTPISNNYNAGYYKDVSYISSTQATYRTGLSYSSSNNLAQKCWIDPETSDFMYSVKYLRPSSYYYGDCVYALYGNNAYISRFMPVDNVEYMMGPLGYYAVYTHSSTNNAGVPDPRGPGRKIQGDALWDHEIVDGVNGIKYYHAVKKARKEAVNSIQPYVVTMHYSLPIVY